MNEESLRRIAQAAKATGSKIVLEQKLPDGTRNEMRFDGSNRNENDRNAEIHIYHSHPDRKSESNNQGESLLSRALGFLFRTQETHISQSLRSPTEHAIPVRNYGNHNTINPGHKADRFWREASQAKFEVAQKSGTGIQTGENSWQPIWKRILGYGSDGTTVYEIQQGDPADVIRSRNEAARHAADIRNVAPKIEGHKYGKDYQGRDVIATRVYIDSDGTDKVEFKKANGEKYSRYLSDTDV